MHLLRLFILLFSEIIRKRSCKLRLVRDQSLPRRWMKLKKTGTRRMHLLRLFILLFPNNYTKAWLQTAPGGGVFVFGRGVE